MAENLETKLEANYEPPELRNNTYLEYIIGEAKEKCGIKLENGKFYSREHFEVIYKLTTKGIFREILMCAGPCLVSLGGFITLASRLIPEPQNLLGVLGFVAAGYGAAVAAVFVNEKFLPIYEKISGRMFNKQYGKYCKGHGIPHDTI